MKIHRVVVGGVAFIILGIALWSLISFSQAQMVYDQDQEMNPTAAPSDTTPEPQAETATVVTASATAALTEVPTPTEDILLPPEQLEDWPVIPTLSPAMVEVYLQGIEMGNDPRRFSKAGDCQNLPAMYLGLFDTPGSYFLRLSEGHLQETIDHFQGSFSRDSMAVKGGFTFPALFSPLRADPNFCSPGESPLECELRIWNPTFLIVSMEYPFPGRTAETYEQYLTRVVEHALARGIVPILTTKADNIEGDNSINQVIARVAYRYDVPMMNYWLSVQELPYGGIDLSDTLIPGFHTTAVARSMRNYDTLRTLDGLLRTVQSLLPSP